LSKSSSKPRRRKKPEPAVHERRRERAQGKTPKSASTDRRYNPVATRAQLKELQRLMAAAIFRPLTANDRMQARWTDGRKTDAVAEEFIKPNTRLSSFERLEIYNRIYWFRILDCIYDDYPGLRAILGERKFMRLVTAYLARYPSSSFTLRDLGQHLEKFLAERPELTAPHRKLARDMARFEWAQVVAFDGEARPRISTDDLLEITPARLRLGLQPYLSLLELNYAVDKFLVAVKKRETAVLRDEASNTFDSMPQTAPRKRRLRLPGRERIYLAVHRFENTLYFKRLEPEAFALLRELESGQPLEKSCEIAFGGSKRRDVDWSLKVREWFHDWSALGWFCRRQK
jgi:hypothetical protein